MSQYLPIAETRQLEDLSEEGTYVVMLGTGTPRCEADCAGTAVAVIVNGKLTLFDAGPGICRRISAARDAGIPGLEFKGADTLFLSHLHSDHTLGLPDLMLSPWVMGRESSLTIHGPRGTDSMVRHLTAAYFEDIRERMEGFERGNGTGFFSEVHEVDDGGQEWEIGEIKVQAFPVIHGSWPAFGFRITTPHACIVISGDTAPFPEAEKIFADADLLIHEVYASAALSEREEKWDSYFRNVHTSDEELGALADKVRPKALALTHQLFWDTDEAEMIAKVKEGYSGELYNCRDLDCFYFGG